MQDENVARKHMRWVFKSRTLAGDVRGYGGYGCQQDPGFGREAAPPPSYPSSIGQLVGVYGSKRGQVIRVSDKGE